MTVEQLQQFTALMFLIGVAAFTSAALIYGLIYRPAQRDLERLKAEYRERYGDELP